MGATSQYRPDTRAPGGGGMDYNGNPIGGGMGAQTNIGGPQMRVGPAYGGQPNPGDLYNPGGNRFMPGRGMLPPAGRVGNPRQVNPGQGGMRPGMRPPMPQPMPFPNPGITDPFPPDLFPPGGSPTPMPSPGPGRGKGGGGGKGGMPGPGRPGFGPAPRPPTQPIFDPGFDGIGGDGGGGEPGVNPYGQAY